MFINFVLRSPGEHQKIADAKMDAVPREGESVSLNDIVRTVHSVTWDLSKMSVTVLLRE